MKPFAWKNLFPPPGVGGAGDLGTVRLPYIISSSTSQRATLSPVMLARRVPPLASALSPQVKPLWRQWQAAKGEMARMHRGGDALPARCRERAREELGAARSALVSGLRSHAGERLAETVLLTYLTDPFVNVDEPNPAMAGPRASLEKVVGETSVSTHLGWWARYVLAGVLEAELPPPPEALALYRELADHGDAVDADARAAAELRAAALAPGVDEKIERLKKGVAVARSPDVRAAVTYQWMRVAYQSDRWRDVVDASQRVIASPDMARDMSPDVGQALAEALSHWPGARGGSMEVSPRLLFDVAMSLATVAVLRGDWDWGRHAAEVARKQLTLLDDPKEPRKRLERLERVLGPAVSAQDRAQRWFERCSGGAIQGRLELSVAEDGEVTAQGADASLLACLRGEAHAFLRGLMPFRVRFER